MLSPRLYLPLLVLCLGWSTSLASGQDQRPSLATFDSPLLISAKGRTLRVATPISRDVREIRLDGVDEIVDVEMAHSATKAVVLTGSRRLLAFDLSNDSPILRPYATRSLATPPSDVVRPRAASHSVPAARFTFIIDGSLLVVDEFLATMSISLPPANLVAGAMRSSTCLLTVSSDGVVTVRDLLRDRDIAGGRIDLSAPDEVDVVSAPLKTGESCQDAPDAGFVVLVHRAGGSLVWNKGNVTTTATRVEALRLAATTLAESARFDDGIAHDDCRDVACDLAVVRPDVDLYLPILQMAAQETVWPSRVDVWRQLAGSAVKPDDQEPKWWPLYEAYASTLARNQCVVYSRTIDYRRSWLIQYWFYFPFDLGNRSPHLHDSEHFFVEVDKRGGTLARLLGGGHGLLSGNNLYTTALDTGYSMTVPIYAFVELGKHATAPDTDKNGFFTPGIDENHYNERSKVWGVRDVIGSINNELLVYDSSMTIPRTPASRYGHADFAKLFPGSDAVPERNRICKIEEWQPKPSTMCPQDAKDSLDPEGLTNCAITKIEHHSDYRDPNAIFKNELFPTFSFRMVAGRMTDGVGRSFAWRMVGEISAWPLVRRLPLTGRISAALSFRRLDSPNPLSPAKKWFVAPIFGYEKFLTNLVGFSLHAGGWDDGILSGGLFVEVPLGRSGMNVTVNVGPTVIGGQSTKIGASFALGLPMSRPHRFR